MSVATAWLDAQEEWIEKAEAELHALLAAGGRVEVSWSKKHWDETQQTLVLDSELLQNARSAWHIMVQRRWTGWLQVDAAGNYSRVERCFAMPPRVVQVGGEIRKHFEHNVK